MERLVEIEGFKGYFISSYGKVYCNLGKGCRRDTENYKTVEPYEVKPRPTKNGYMRVYMRNSYTNKRIDKYIHRLVAYYFVENPDKKRVVNHIDCDRSNNSAVNLEWVTTKENVDHAMNVGSLERDLSNGRYKRKNK